MADIAKFRKDIVADGKWVFINWKLNDMWDYTEADNKKQMNIGDYVELKEGAKIPLDKNVE